MNQFMPMIDTGPFKREYPFQSRYFIREDGLALHYVDEGSGPPVVMVHGNPTWSFMYRNLIKKLSPDFRCLAADQMGMGLSSRPPADKYSFRLEERIDDFTKLMEHWRPDQPVHLVVHDWGGPVGLGWAVKNPGRVASITIMNSAAYTPEGPERKLPWRLKAVYNSGPLAGWLVVNGNLFVKGAVSTNTVHKMPVEVRRGFTAPYAEKNDRLAVLKFVKDIPLNHSHPSFNALLNIEGALNLLKEHPALLVWGLKDAVFTADFLTHWQKIWPKAQAVPLARAGHLPLEDEPEIALSRIADFIGSRPRRPDQE